MLDKWLSRLRLECKCVLRGSLSLKGTSYLYVSNCHVSVSPWPLNLLVSKSSDGTILPLFPPSSHTQPYSTQNIMFFGGFLPSCCDQVWLWLFDTCLQYFLSHPPWCKGHGKNEQRFNLQQHGTKLINLLSVMLKQLSLQGDGEVRTLGIYRSHLAHYLTTGTG